jgi:hypothetical protein
MVGILVIAAARKGYFRATKKPHRPCTFHTHLTRGARNIEGIIGAAKNILKGKGWEPSTFKAVIQRS